MPRPLLRRLDQLAIATLTLAAIAVLGVWLAAQLGRGRLVEIESAAPLRYEFLVNVNEADWPELAQLPGIGEVLARRIRDSRQNDGEYRTADDLLRVNGIGPRKLAQIKRHLLPLADDDQVAGR